MGLFDKKYCDVCGEKIGFLGNKKLEDANLCKNCAKKLSPWFNDRRHSTLEEIKAQLAYREENKEAVKAFNITRSFGADYTKLLVDENSRKFMVTNASARDLEEANPDVIDIAQVTNCRLDIDEDRDQIYRKNKEGESVSYNPPRYRYYYNFRIFIEVNHPYFDELRFDLNKSRVDNGENKAGEAGYHSQPVNSGNGVADTILNVLNAAADLGNGYRNPEYDQYVEMGQEICDILMNTRRTIREEAAAAKAPKKKMICPACGAATIPDSNGCCEYCGSTLV